MNPRLRSMAIGGAGLGALLATVLMVGTMLGWSMAVRSIVVMAIVVIALILVVVKLIRDQRNAKGIEAAMQSQAQAQAQGARPDRQGEIRQLQEQFDRAIKTLKESKLERGRRGATALYALPWYLFVGPPAAGKTTAIAHSGLRFPLGTNRVRGVGGTRNCDWFFADSAIILDTAGRYMTEDQDAEEWHAFLGALRKHRKHQPINGVLVGMSAAELVQMSPAELDLHAEAFRQRLDELVRLLGVQFPVYLVLTKCDLLGGFVEFFGDLTKAEREQVWGATLELDDARPPAEAFAEEFDALTDALLDERLARLVRPMKRDERQAIYAFPLEVAALKERLVAFVDQLFLPNPYQDTPHFRGFYLTSGTQEGAPIDRVISAVAEELGLPPQPAGAAHFDVETKSYFLKDLFTDVVIPDQHIVRRTKQPSAVPVAAVAAGVGLLVFALLLFWAGWQSRADIRGVETAAVALGEAGPRAASGETVVRLAGLQGAVAEARGGGWRLYDRDRLLDPADRLWLERTRAFINEHGIEVIEQRLAGADASAEGAAWQRLYEDLQAYLLLSDETARLSGDEGEANRELVVRHLDALARADGVVVPEPAALTRLHTAYLAALAEGRVAPFRANPTLVRRAQAVLSRAPGIELSYSRILQEGSSQFEDLDPAAIAGRGANVFATSPVVPGVFTRAAWDGYVRAAIAERSRAPDRSDWVVGRVSGLALTPEQAGDAEGRLRSRYFADYAEAWEGFLAGLRYGSAATVADAAQRLVILGDPRSSPLLLVLARTATETDFSLPEAPPASAAVPGAPPPTRVEAGAEAVAQRFAWLHALHPDLAASGGAAPELTAALLAMADLGAELEGGGGEARLVTYQMAVRRVPMDPDLRERLFEAPMVAGGSAAEAAAAGAAAAALDDQWGAAYQFFRDRLSGRYPFDPTSGQDALLEDVDAFFNPSGGLVASFLEPGDDEAAMSAAARSALARTRAISRALFDRGELGVDFELQPELPEKPDEAPPVVEYVLNLLGQTNVYQMGTPPTIRCRWPDRSGALLKVQTRDGTLQQGADGDWAVFRLFQRAEVQRRASREYVLAWPLRAPEGYTIRARYLLTTRADPGLVQDPAAFLTLRLPARLSR